MNPYLRSVKPQEDFCLLLTFDNGEKRIFDLKPYFVFAQLKNIALFITARVVSGAVEWQGDVDLSYDTLYLGSKPVKIAQPRRKTNHGTKKNLAMPTIRKKKPFKARVPVK